MDFANVSTFTVEDSLDDQCMKVLEEANELFSECHKGDCAAIVHRVLEEAVDTVTAVANVLEYLGVEQDKIDEAIGRCNGRNAERGRIPAWVVRVGDSYVSDCDIDGYDNVHLELSDGESMLFLDEDKACQFCEMLSEKLCMDAYVESSDTLKS